MSISRRLLNGEDIASVLSFPEMVEELTAQEHAEAARDDLNTYVAGLAVGPIRAELHRSLLLLQRRFFFLANRLAFVDLKPVYEAYQLAYRTLEDALYELDMIPEPPLSAAAPEEEEDDGTLFMKEN